METATWCRTPATASAARRLRPEISKNSSTALSSHEGELARSITTCVPAMASLRPSPVMLLTPVLGEAAANSSSRRNRQPAQSAGSRSGRFRPRIVRPMAQALLKTTEKCARGNASASQEGRSMKGKARTSHGEKQSLDDEVAATYDAFKEFEGRRYTGMRVGRGHKWNYDPGVW